jgi:hypothetical protein
MARLLLKVVVAPDIFEAYGWSSMNAWALRRLNEYV